MTIWPHGIGLAILFSGLFLIMLVPRGREISLSRGLKFFVLFSLVATFVQVAAMASVIDVFTVSNKAYFSFSSYELIFALCALIYLILSHFNVYIDKQVYERELAALQVAAAFLSLTLIFSNHLLIVIIGLPLLVLIVAFAPQLAYKSKSKISMNQGVSWALIVMILLALSGGLLYQEFQTLYFSEIQRQLADRGFSQASMVAWGTPLVLFSSLLCFSAFNFFSKDYERADSWVLIGQFRLLLPLLGAIMFCRWMLSMAGLWEGSDFIPHKGFDTSAIALMLFGLMSVVVVIQTLALKKISQVFQIYSLQPLLLTLLGLSLKDKDSLSMGVGALLLYCMAVPLSLRLFIIMDLKAFENLSGGRLALRGAGFFQRLHLFVLYLVFSPLLTFIGFTLVTRMNKGTAELEWLQFLPIACAALLLVSLVTVLGELFDDFSTRPSDNTQSSFADNILGYSLLIFVIALGIYPSPLYKYLSYILERATI